MFLRFFATEYDMEPTPAHSFGTSYQVLQKGLVSYWFGPSGLDTWSSSKKANTKQAMVAKRTRWERIWIEWTSSVQEPGWSKAAASLRSSPSSSFTSSFPTWSAKTIATSWRRTSPASSPTFQKCSSGQFAHLVWVFLGRSIGTRLSRKEELLTLEQILSVVTFSWFTAYAKSHLG